MMCSNHDRYRFSLHEQPCNTNSHLNFVVMVAVFILIKTVAPPHPRLPTSSQSVTASVIDPNRL